MLTGYLSHADCLGHDTGDIHPESAGRLGAIEDRLIETGLFDLLHHVEAPEASRKQLLRVHTPAYLDRLAALEPAEGRAWLDPDTLLGPGLAAARRAAGAAIEAVDRVIGGSLGNAFCAVRPPGHHAESDRGMGFCLYNNIAVGAAHALAAHRLARIAILDFDVHQGNGTEAIFLDDERVLFCSTFQHPFYPGTPLIEGNERMVSVPLAAGARGVEFRAAVERCWLPAIKRFAPQMFFVSAGFDAHRDDDMSGLNLEDADYAWVSERIVDAADRFAGGRLVSSLEGGYELRSLGRCVERHLRILMGLG